MESVPEDLVALKQHFEDYTAAVVDEVAEEWLEKNGGWVRTYTSIHYCRECFS